MNMGPDSYAMSATLSLGTFPARRTFTSMTAGTWLIGNKKYILAAGETIELPSDAHTVAYVSDVPTTLTVAIPNKEPPR